MQVYIRLLCVFLLTITECYSQLVSYYPNTNFNEEKPVPCLYGFVRRDNNKIFSFDVIDSGARKEILVEKLNDKLDTIYKKGFLAQKDERRKELLIGKDRIYVFTTIFNGSDKQLFLTILNEGTGEIVSPKQLVASLNSDKHGLDGRKYFASLSPDKSKLLIVSAYQWIKKAQVVKAEIYEASNMRLINTLKLPDSYEGKLIKTRNYLVTDNGSVFFKANQDQEEIAPYMRMPFLSEDAELQEQLDLLNSPPSGIFCLWNSNENQYRFLNSPMGNRKISNARLLIKNGTFSYFGVFEDDSFDKVEKARNGIFNMSIDINTLKVISADFNYFPEKMFSKIYPDGHRKPPFKYLGFNRLVCFESGIYLIETIETIGGNYSAPSSDLIISKFDSLGKFEFTKIIPKRTADEISGFDCLISNNNLYLLYCDSPTNILKFNLDNYDPKDYLRINKGSGSETVCVKVSSNGELTRQIVFANDSWTYEPGKTSNQAEINKSEFIIKMKQNDHYKYYTIRVLK